MSAQNARRRPLLSPRRLLRSILMLEDTPRSIALGTTIGMFVGLTPTVGMQMVLVGIIAFLTRPFLKFNRVAALLTVYISNPITMIPIYILDYKVGQLFLGGSADLNRLETILQYNSFGEWWETVVSLFVEFGAPLVFGSLIVGIVGAVATYPFMIWVLNSMGGHRVVDPAATKAEPVSTAAEPVGSASKSATP